MCYLHSRSVTRAPSVLNVASLIISSSRVVAGSAELASEKMVVNRLGSVELESDNVDSVRLGSDEPDSDSVDPVRPSSVDVLESVDPPSVVISSNAAVVLAYSSV